MVGSSKFGVALWLALTVGALGCSGGGGAASGSAAASAKPSSTPSGTASAAKVDSAKPADSGTPAGEEAAVDPKKLFDDKEEGDANGLIGVDLSAAGNIKAPKLGGASEAPPPPPQGAQLTWIDAGPLQIPNPGWKQEDGKGFTALSSPDNKGGIFFTVFDDPKDGFKKVDEIVANLKLKEMKWSKPKEVKIGPNNLPAYFGKGTGKSAKGEPGKIFYALVKTGGQKNLLCLGGADADGGDASLETALKIVSNIKKK